MSSLSVPLQMHFEVTNFCNNKCPHCYATSWIKGNDDFTHVFEIANAIIENDIFDVVITGGEPLCIGKNNLIALCKLFRDNNIKFSLNTNGRLLDSDICQKLVESGLKSTLISLHSWDDDIHDEIVYAKNASKETKIGIKNAINQGLHVTVNQVISKKNIAKMFESSVELEKFGVNAISFTKVISPLDVDYKIDMVSASEFLDQYIKCKEKLKIPVKSLHPICYCSDPRVKEIREDLKCSGGISSGAVSCKGDVRFCPQDSKIWGNILSEDLKSIWSKINQWRGSVGVPSECENCAFLPDCGGGCRIAAKVYSGDYLSKDPWATGAIDKYVRKVIYHEFDSSKTYLKNPNIRYRKEGNDVLIYVNNKITKINNDGLLFIEGLPKLFIPDEIINNNDDNAEGKISFLELLYQVGGILRIKEGNMSNGRKNIFERKKNSVGET